ncbi:ABC transporter ATP-binding protein [Roseibium aestuarii]|uniref:ABC transporter ATP-binding protein n=1 Tax=Roseibium aestuarii TaxID=2600299 RepID=A0ABW4JX81_9HYPH|nr:ABC transporter ATP-binding protein [Roseibium aestuarii]
MSILVSAARKLFGSHPALDDVSLSVAEGEFFVVLGPSGCGKSTLLRAIAGLEPLDEGAISLGGEQVAGPGLHVPPERRNVGVVFQSYALWPHMSVAQNVAFPLESAGASRSMVEGRVATCLETVELSAHAGRKPADLSGGQRQRVALARCLAQGARTVLMDEPLANLDPHLRAAMEEELAAFHQRSGATTLFITHDQREAMALADRMAVMWAGRVLQAGTPEELYDRPCDERVAGFIGRSSRLNVTVQAVRGPRALVLLGKRQVEVACGAEVAAGPARLMLRPEHLAVAGEASDLAGRVARVTYRGGVFEALVRVEGLDAPLLVNLPQRARIGDTLALKVTGGWLLPR